MGTGNTGRSTEACKVSVRENGWYQRRRSQGGEDSQPPRPGDPFYGGGTEGMKGVVLDGNPETPRKLQELARHEFICKMLSEILMDVMICRQEGWDETEFNRQLHGELDGLMKKIEQEEE